MEKEKTMRNNCIFVSRKIFTVTLFAILVFSCDNRTPTKSNSSSASSENYNLEITAQPYATDSGGNAVVVGEDIVGSFVKTRIDVILKDSTGSVLPNKLIEFSAKVEGVSFGEFNINSSYTNADGLASVNFLDKDQSAYDNAATPTHEGVTVEAKHVVGKENFSITIRFDVFDTSAVQLWPYQLNLSSNTGSIKVDDGLTSAELSAKITSRQYGQALKDLEVYFESTNGRLSELSKFTDTLGTALVDFSDTGDPEEAGVSTIVARYQHPAFGTLIDSVQITILDTTYSGTPAYAEIPSSYPGEIMVVSGGGLESTQICARVFDENGVLVNEPVNVTFTLGPNIPSGANLNNAGISDSAFTADGEACVSINSGTGPGPIRVTATVLTDSGEVITATATPVIIATGPPYYLEPDYNPQETEPIGGGFYLTEAAAIVYDRWYNPVSDSTYVYWSMEPNPLEVDTVIDAFVQGVSFTGNENLNGDNFPGVAYTTITYSTDAIGDLGLVSALTFGTNGDTIMARINEEEGEAIMFFVPGQLALGTPTQYWDFSTMGPGADIQVTATLIDYYGNAVSDADIMLTATGAAGIYYPVVPVEDNIAPTNDDGQVTFVVRYDQGICSPIPNSDPLLYEDFTSTIVAYLLIPQQITSDPLEILFVRTYQP